MTPAGPRRAAAVVATLAWVTTAGGLAVSCSSGSSSAPTPSPSVAAPSTARTAPSSPPTADSASPSASGTVPVGLPDPPSDATVEDFCAANSAANAPATDDTARAAKAAIERLRRVGTPAGIPADARAGLLVLLAVVEAIPDDATAEEVKRAGSDLAPADQRQVVAYFTYAAQTCPTAGG